MVTDALASPPSLLDDAGMDWQVIRENLRVAIERRGWSHNALANAAGVPQPTISRFLKGDTHGMTLDNLAALAEALGVHIAQLIGELPLAVNSKLATVLRAMQTLPDYKRDVIAATADSLLRSEPEADDERSKS